MWLGYLHKMPMPEKLNNKRIKLKNFIPKMTKLWAIFTTDNAGGLAAFFIVYFVCVYEGVCCEQKPESA